MKDYDYEHSHTDEVWIPAFCEALGAGIAVLAIIIITAWVGVTV